MGALEGIRVLELGSFIAGPFAGQLLADHGAEVIKVEPPQGDPMRSWGVQLKDGQSLWWPVIGRNKKSVVLDLQTKQGQRLVRKLVTQVDVLLENFRPGVLEKLGQEPQALLAENPRLVIAWVSGFGQTGPYREQAGFGSLAEAMGGLRYHFHGG
ncbi:CoA transferase [Meiothermus sp. QL-1]|uniref:CoA transferase n=1 Tax=Meiothermus sp. QL-1 TaxID=2058095 RepID=UPI0018F15320|nr:CoA transferase [Meiothermus sp. QL-1]